jgi:hypothetical protein
MIQLRADIIMVSDGTGCVATFDPEELELHLTRCCRAVGLRDAWLPEDLALAVEDALLRADERRTYHRNEIHLFVMKVLRDLGLGDVAEHYRLTTRPEEDRMTPEAPAVVALLVRHLGLPDAAATRLAAETAAACQRLGLPRATPAFLVELARHLRDVREPVPPPAAAPSRSKTTATLVARDEILAAIPAATAALLAAGALALPTGISRLFPALKLDLHLVNFAELRGWERPTTELVLFPALPALAAAIAPLLDAARAVAQTRNPTAELPLVLRCPDLPRFTTAWLGADWPAGAGTGHAVLEALASHLAPPVRIATHPRATGNRHSSNVTFELS